MWDANRPCRRELLMFQSRPRLSWTCVSRYHRLTAEDWAGPMPGTIYEKKPDLEQVGIFGNGELQMLGSA